MNSRQTTWFVVIMFAAFAYLGMKGLDNAWFWDDEAFASIIAKNWNATGECTVWDGRNLVKYPNKLFLPDDMSHTVGTFPIYLITLSQKIFGATTFAGRFPSVLAGLAAFLLLNFCLSRQFGRGSPTHLYMLSLFALSASQLLFIRTGRYYSMSLALGLASFALYLIYVERRTPASILGLGAIMILFYYTNPLLWVCFSASLAVHFLIFHIRSLTRRDSLWIGLSAAIVLGICLPSIIKNQIGAIPLQETEVPYCLDKLTILWYYVRDFNLLGVCAWPLSIALIAIFSWRVFKTKKSKISSLRPWIDWSIIGSVYILVLALLTWQSSDETVHADMRYAVPAIPFLTILSTAACALLHRRHWLIGASLALTLTMTNILGALPGNRWNSKWLLPAYLKEIHNPYPTAIQRVTAYLKDKAQQDDLIYAMPFYESYPLMFYMGDRLKISGMLDEKSPNKGKVPGDPDYLYTERTIPDWVLLYGLHQDPREVAAYFGRPRPPDLTKPSANYKIEAILDVFWSNIQKPEPAAHRFSPVTEFDPKREGVIILKRVPLP